MWDVKTMKNGLGTEGEKLVVPASRAALCSRDGCTTNRKTSRTYENPRTLASPATKIIDRLDLKTCKEKSVRFVPFRVPLALPVLNRCVHVALRTLAKPVAPETDKLFRQSSLIPTGDAQETSTQAGFYRRKQR